MVRSCEIFAMTQRVAKIILTIIILSALVVAVFTDACADMTVFGSVSGRWLRDLSPYYVMDSIYVPEGEELVIEPGVQVLFNGIYRFTVFGLLRAEGGVEENERIRFSNGRTTQWLGIEFFQEADARSRLVNCDIDSAWWGVSINNHSGLLIQGCSINALSIGISCNRAAPYIHNNRLISASGANTISSVKAILLENSSNPQIVNNQLIIARAYGGGEAYGIHSVRSSPLLYGNWIEARSDVGATGIHIERTFKLLINRNIIRTYSMRSMRGLWILNASGISFESNTLHLMASSNDAIGIFMFGSEVEIRNNIVIGNGSSIGDRTIGGTVHGNSGWNDYWLHATNHFGGWNGGEGEIHADPLFANFTINSDADYHLTWASFPDRHSKSPCIDAGCPNITDEGDIYNTRSDIGRYPFIYNPAQTSVSLPATLAAVFDLKAVYPNPFNSSANIEFALSQPGQISVKAFDTRGCLTDFIYNGALEAGFHRIAWTPKGIAAGSYIVKLQSNTDEQTVMLIYSP
ncbi:MAG: right-handed parallel beta-helix repeat-containing protein [Calditrichaeota bacterium]|nr:right-handed parallel beta-helix repeat-containing protein [Calditrichota bacterium]